MEKTAAAAMLAVVLTASTAHAATPGEIRALIDQGKLSEAWTAARAAPERLGQPDFDFVYGVAAIAAGRATEGVLALERYLLAFPDNDPARVELARGYLAIGEDARAREEFQAVLDRRPPPAVARAIEDYLETIRTREAKHRPTAMAYALAGTGYDSNPRAGVDDAEITLPVFGPVTVVDTGLRRGDQVREYAAGIRLTAPWTPALVAYAAGSADARRHSVEKDFDQAQYAGTAGVVSRRGAWTFRGGASLSYTTLGSAPYRRVHGLNADAGYEAGPADALSLGVQAGRFAYEAANVVRDSDFLTVAWGLRHQAGGAWRPEFEASATWGREKNRRDRDDLSRHMAGVRFGAAVTPRAGWSVGATASWQKSRYDEADTGLSTVRDDAFAAGEAWASWQFTRHLQLRAEFSAARNDSNIALYEYKRHTAMIRLRAETR